MIVYIGGPMRGYDKYNFPAFDAAALWLRASGHEVINPAELDRVIHVHEYTDPLPEGFMRSAMKRDLVAICDQCEGMVLLPGWPESRGVVVEKALAELLGLPIFYANESLSFDHYMEVIVGQMEDVHAGTRIT